MQSITLQVLDVTLLRVQVARDFDLYPVLKRYDTFTVSLKDEDDPEAEPYYMIYETVKSGCNMSKKPPGDIKSLISRRLGHGWECYAKKQNIRYGVHQGFSWFLKRLHKSIILRLLHPLHAMQC